MAGGGIDGKCLECREQFKTGLLMEEHLESNQRCKLANFQHFQVNGIVNVCFQTNGCFFCQLKTGSKLKSHLNGTEVCKRQYLSKFEAESVTVLMKTIKNIKRKSYPSRTRAERQSERESLILRFRKSVAVGPHTYLCVTCSSSGTRKIMFVFEETSPGVEEKFYREGILYQCKECYHGKDVNFQEPFLQEIGKFSVDFFGMFGPVQNIEVVSDSDVSVSSVLLPTSIAAIQQIHCWRDPQSQNNNIRDLFKNILNFSENHYSFIYERTFKGIKDSLDYNVVLPGYVTHPEHKEVLLLTSASNLADLPGTDEYYLRGQSNLLYTIFQAGPVFLSTKLIIPHFLEGTFATQLMLNGLFRLEISTSEGKTENCEYSEGMTEYLIHPDHLKSEPCGDNCEPILLQHFLNEIPNVNNHLSIGTIANYANHFCLNFLTSIVRDKFSILYPDYYDANFEFPIWTDATMFKIATWPKIFSAMNEKIARKISFTREDLQNFTILMDGILTTSTSSLSLAAEFGLDEDAADDVAALALRHQAAPSMDKVVQLPSILTMIKIAPKIFKKTDEESFSLIRTKFESELLLMNEFELGVNVSTWLNDLENNDFIKAEMVEEVICVEFFDAILEIDMDEEIAVFMEENSFSLLEAVYHRSLNFHHVTCFDIILKSDSLQAAFVHKYHPPYLLAARLPVKSNIIGGNYRSAGKILKCGQPEPIFETGSPLEIFQSTHKQVPLIEALWRIDKRKGFTCSNIRPKFINLTPNRTLKFIRARTADTSKHFIDKRTQKLYEIFQDGYEDFLHLPQLLQRILTCWQFLSEFFKSGFDNAAEVEDETNLDREIDEDSEETFAVGRQIAVCNDHNYGDLKLPDKIILTNNVVYQRRKTVPKIIAYPYFDKASDEYLLREMQLYRPHERDMFTGISSEGLHMLFKQKDDDPEYFKGRPLTKIETIKLRLNPILSDFDPDSELGCDNIKVVLS